MLLSVGLLRPGDAAEIWKEHLFYRVVYESDIGLPEKFSIAAGFLGEKAKRKWGNSQSTRYKNNYKNNDTQFLSQILLVCVVFFEKRREFRCLGSRIYDTVG